MTTESVIYQEIRRTQRIAYDAEHNMRVHLGCIRQNVWHVEGLLPEML